MANTNAVLPTPRPRSCSTLCTTPCSTLLLVICGILTSRVAHAEFVDPDDVRNAMHRAATFFHGEVATHGGYVYFYTTDLTSRWGEGEATPDQIWVQPPGTPTVGMAFLKAYSATKDADYLHAATQAAEALVYGQLESGGWTNCIDFDPQGARTAQYRNGKGRGKNYSSLDDGQTQSAIHILIHVDRAHGFRHGEIHRAAMAALDALLAAQFPNGGFPQVWKQPVSAQRVLPASYPDYDWRTEGRIKEYWNMYTLNDNVCGYVARTLRDAYEIYGEKRFLIALQRLGDFLILAQMPAPQRGWAQQYNYDMKPIWARKFEPPALASDETQEAIETLLLIHDATGDARYLQPVSPALQWLNRSQLPDGLLARYYELETNRPLYMSRRGDVYSLTYDDSDLPSHYGWKIAARIGELEARFQAARTKAHVTSSAPTEKLVREILAGLDAQGRWISIHRGERLVGQPPFREGMRYISSEVFSDNVTALSEYLMSLPANRESPVR